MAKLFISAFQSIKALCVYIVLYSMIPISVNATGENTFDYQAFVISNIYYPIGPVQIWGDAKQETCLEFIAVAARPALEPGGAVVVFKGVDNEISQPSTGWFGCHFDSQYTREQRPIPLPLVDNHQIIVSGLCQTQNHGPMPNPGSGEYDSPRINIGGDCYCSDPYVFDEGVQWCARDFSCPSGQIASVDNGVWTCEHLPVPEKEVGPTCPSPYDSSNDNAPSPATGNTYTKTTDFSSPRRSNSFTRHKNNNSGLANSPLGHGWSASGFQTLGVDGNNIVVMQAIGRSEPGICSGVGVCSLDPDSRISLEQTSTGYKVTTANNNVEVYDIVGKLLSVTEPSGQVTTMSHNSNGLVETITDHFGSVISFTYNVDNKVVTMTDPDNNIYTYAYDANDNLVSVTYPDSTTKQYLYEDTNFPNHITGIIDERSIRIHTWSYDTQGRALYFEKAGGAERIDYTYNIDGTTTVTDSLGATNTYTFAESHGVKRTIAISGGQCATGCAQGQAQSYDANGFLSSRTDFEGNVINYTNNSRGLEISRTEAVGTPQARTITTEWHATFRLPTKITEPGKETTFTYDTNGKLLTRNEKTL